MKVGEGLDSSRKSIHVEAAATKTRMRAIKNEIFVQRYMEYGVLNN